MRVLNPDRTPATLRFIPPGEVTEGRGFRRDFGALGSMGPGEAPATSADAWRPMRVFRPPGPRIRLSGMRILMAARAASLFVQVVDDRLTARGIPGGIGLSDMPALMAARAAHLYPGMRLSSTHAPELC